MTLPAPEFAKGTAIGKHEILRKIATGGMAEIYLSRARGTGGFEKLVVLKRILPNVAADPQFVQMFLDEARLAATLQHPNIADVYDVGEADGSYFFTMEFIHGEDARTLRIASRKADTRIPLPISLAIVYGAAAALSYAHAKVGPEGPLGLVHRDVSSSNILISFDGAVKLVDFGIARATTRQHKTRTGALKGKIPYMSPEQCQNMELDRRTDLFSLGVVLFELTLGRRPYRGDSDYSVFEAIIKHPAPHPSTIDPSYPPELAAIVMKLLERDLQKRYQTADALIADLDAFMAANNAWVSPVTVGRYMRETFAQKVEAWHSAEEQGTSLGEHVAQTITSESLRGELRVTPVSSFDVPPEPPSDLSSPPHPPPRPFAPSRGSRWLPLLLPVGAVVVGLAIYILAAPSKAPRSSSSPPPEPTVPSQPSVAAPPPPTPTAASPTPAPAPPSTPIVREEKPAEAPVTIDKRAVHTAKPAIRNRPPKAAVPAKPTKPTKPVVTATKPDEAGKGSNQPPPPPKDNTWDRNSLALPK